MDWMLTAVGNFLKAGSIKFWHYDQKMDFILIEKIPCCKPNLNPISLIILIVWVGVKLVYVNKFFQESKIV